MRFKKAIAIFRLRLPEPRHIFAGRCHWGCHAWHSRDFSATITISATVTPSDCNIDFRLAASPPSMSAGQSLSSATPQRRFETIATTDLAAAMLRHFRHDAERWPASSMAAAIPMLQIAAAAQIIFAATPLPPDGPFLQPISIFASAITGRFHISRANMAVAEANTPCRLLR